MTAATEGLLAANDQKPANSPSKLLGGHQGLTRLVGGWSINLGAPAGWTTERV